MYKKWKNSSEEAVLGTNPFECGTARFKTLLKVARPGKTPLNVALPGSPPLQT